MDNGCYKPSKYGWFINYCFINDISGDDRLWSAMNWESFPSKPAQTDIGFGTLFIQRCILIPGVYIWLGIWSQNPTCKQRLVLGWMKIIKEVGSSCCYLPVMGRKSDTSWHVVLWRLTEQDIFSVCCSICFFSKQLHFVGEINGWKETIVQETMVQDTLRFQMFLQIPSGDLT